MTSYMVIRDCCIGVGFVALMMLILVVAGVPYAVLEMLGGIGVGLYLFGTWVSVRYE